MSSCERFSAYNRIEVELRQKIAVKTVKSLLSISVNGREPELFDFPEALSHWKHKNNYRHIYSLITSKLL